MGGGGEVTYLLSQAVTMFRNIYSVHGTCTVCVDIHVDNIYVELEYEDLHE